ncbi:MAG: hypothetical protein GY842_11155, partial [bacterium]|nr:hypothetical protein [bacterium]
RQHGLPTLRVADLVRDLDLLELTRADAAALIAEDPRLGSPHHQPLRRALEQELGDVLGLVDVA